MKYQELIQLPNKELIEKLDTLSSNELIDLMAQAQEYYIHYSEQTDKYCGSVNEKMVRDENNNPLYPKFNKNQLISEEQFQKLLGKIKKCENIVSVIYGCLNFKLVMEEDSVDEDSQQKLESMKGLFSLI